MHIKEINRIFPNSGKKKKKINFLYSLGGEEDIKNPIL